MLITEALLLLLTCFLAVPVSALLAEVLFSLGGQNPIEEIGARPSLAVIIPAHNEAPLISATIASVMRQLHGGDRLIVVADNCSDDTAEIAERCGAEVASRSNSELRGKGYALDHGLSYLEQTGATAVVVFIDADCQLSDDCLGHLARLSMRTLRPVQAAYLMNPARSSNSTAAIVTFAWRIKNFVRPLGWHKLGFPCQLAGSGMALPWSLIRLANTANGALAEDLKLGLDLALAGKFPLLCPEAVVMSDVAKGGMPSSAQRARWEHGTLEVALVYLPRLISAAWKTRSLKLLAIILDISIPPLAFLALALGAGFCICFGFALFTGIALPAVAMAGLGGLLFLSILLAWWRFGRDLIPLHLLMFAPAYALNKVPMYVRFFVDRQRQWTRGER